jgi:putative transcriptional regulator
MVLTEKELIARDAKRDIGAEILAGLREVNAGIYGAKYEVMVNEVTAARLKTGLSQAEFAAALHISKRTLQQWEQGRRKPSGAAVTLLRIASLHPDVLKEVAVPA